MKPNQATKIFILTTLILTLTLPLAFTILGNQTPEEAGAQHVNWRSNGTYLLKTDNPHSIQAYYQDVGMTPLILPTRMEFEDMQETCLALGEHWRPLGHILLSDYGGEDPFPFELCYFTAPNPDWVAKIKCANLGLGLIENKRLQREIVCGRQPGSS